jgi:hypothetical protein
MINATEWPETKTKINEDLFNTTKSSQLTELTAS